MLSAAPFITESTSLPNPGRACWFPGVHSPTDQAGTPTPLGSHSWLPTWARTGFKNWRLLSSGLGPWGGRGPEAHPCLHALLQMDPHLCPPRRGQAVPPRAGPHSWGLVVDEGSSGVEAQTPPRSSALVAAPTSTGPPSPAGTWVPEHTHRWGVRSPGPQGEAPSPRPSVALDWSWRAVAVRLLTPDPALPASACPSGQTRWPARGACGAGAGRLQAPVGQGWIPLTEGNWLSLSVSRQSCKPVARSARELGQRRFGFWIPPLGLNWMLNLLPLLS